MRRSWSCSDLSTLLCERCVCTVLYNHKPTPATYKHHFTSWNDLPADGSQNQAWAAVCRRGDSLILYTFASHPTSDSTDCCPLIHLIIGIRYSFDRQWFAYTSTRPFLAVEYAPRGTFTPCMPRTKAGVVAYSIPFLFDSYITTYVFERHVEDNSCSTSEELEEWWRNYPKPPLSILIYDGADPMYPSVILILTFCLQLLLDLVFCPLSCFASPMSRCCCTLFDRIGSFLTLVSGLIATTLNTEFKLVHKPIETTL